MKEEKLVEILEKILEKLEQIDWKLYEFYKSMITGEEEFISWIDRICFKSSKIN